MKLTKIFLVYITGMLLLMMGTTPLQAYNDNIYFQSEDFSQDLNLDAVASLFGRSKDLADFEWQLNDPDNQISNLDLNGDNQVDYLRIIERMQDTMRLIVIQAIVGPDLYQDIATIELDRGRYNDTTIQIVGDPYIYGDDCIVEPYYNYTPLIYSYFWSSRYYRPYYSHYLWGNYPRHYRAWRPRPIDYYNRNVYRHIDRKNQYRYTNRRKNHRAKKMYRGVRRGDYAQQYPDRSHRQREKRRSAHYREGNRGGHKQLKPSNHSKNDKQHRNNAHTGKKKNYTNSLTRRHNGNQHRSNRHNTVRSTRQRTQTRQKATSTRRQMHSNQQRTQTSRPAQSAQRLQTRQSIQSRSLQRGSQTTPRSHYPAR